MWENNKTKERIVKIRQEDGSNREVPVYFYYPDVDDAQVEGKQRNSDNKFP